jgi:hypothetical protein
MSIINWELHSKLKKKKRLTYSKEIISIDDFSVWGKIKKFFKKLLFKK